LDKAFLTEKHLERDTGPILAMEAMKNEHTLWQADENRIKHRRNSGRRALLRGETVNHLPNQETLGTANRAVMAGYIRERRLKTQAAEEIWARRRKRRTPQQRPTRKFESMGSQALRDKKTQIQQEGPTNSTIQTAKHDFFIET
jgi:hypothetical protein